VRLRAAPWSGSKRGDANSFRRQRAVLPKLDRADVILALDSDFLDCGQGDLETVRGFTSRRRVKRFERQHEPAVCGRTSFHLTGAMADHRLRCPASQIPAFAHALATKIHAGTNDSGLGSLLGNFQGGQTLSTSNGLMGCR
jgi:molybdopterin-containing oxidoreductase family iron-sulfur binding subunit